MELTPEQILNRASAAATHLEDQVFNAPGLENDQFEDFMVALAHVLSKRYGVCIEEGGENA